jgi:hypothetical protein
MAILTILPFIGKALESVFSVVDKLVVDKDARERLKADIQTRILVQDAQELENLIASQREIIIAEAKGEGWLQRSWRPLLMLWFAGLVGAYWVGWTAPNLPENAVLSLLGIVQFGIGGYVVGRSGEKIVSTIAEHMGEMWQQKQK